MNKDEQLISVVIIFLNAERYIEEAIESVFAQTYSNWELLLVDDGSTDNSSEIARKYAERNPGTVRYLEHPGRQNRGMSSSRNLGVRHARGQLIALLDADDIWLTHKLADQVALLEAHPEAMMVYDATIMWYGWTGDHRDEQRDLLRRLGVPANTLVKSPDLIPLFLNDDAWTPGTCSVMFRREAFDAVGGFEETFRGMYEDQAFFFKICLDFPVYVAGGFSSKYRQHHTSCCHLSAQSGLWRPGRLNDAEHRFLTWFESYLAQKGIRDSAVGRTLGERLWAYRHPIAHRMSILGEEVKKSILMRLKNAIKQVIPSAARKSVLCWYRGLQLVTDRVPVPIGGSGSNR
jgi:glycosyltransferase involved in cell wall biosynthesis